MAKIQYVKKVDKCIRLKKVIVSCTDKEGLVTNIRKDKSFMNGIPSNGILGFIQEKNPDVLFISTGGTYDVIKETGLNVMELSEYTGYPEMQTGLVKSLHPKVHAGILGHKYTEDDAIFMEENNIFNIDAVIVNYYPLEDMKNNKESTFEMIRQAIDVGGPTLSHNSRKAFISTSLITTPDIYPLLIDELNKNNGAVSLKARLDFAKLSSRRLNEYLVSVNDTLQSISYEDLERTYEIIDREV